MRLCLVNRVRVWVRVRNSIPFFKYYSRIRVRVRVKVTVSLLKFLIILAFTLPSSERRKGVRIMGVGITGVGIAGVGIAVCTSITV